MRYYAYKQAYEWINSKFLAIPNYVKNTFYFTISVALFSFSVIVLVIALTLAKQLLGMGNV